MDFIETIKQSETQAEEILREAQAEAQRIKDNALLRQKEELDITATRLSGLRSEALQKQKSQLKELYKTILADGATEASRLEDIAKKNTSKAVQLLLSKI